MAAKRPKIAEKPAPKKKPRVADPHIEGRPLAWRFSGADRDGPFSWAGLTPSDKFREVVEKLHEYEAKQWADILRGGCHPIEITQLCKDAQDRLVAIERDDIDDLMSFRMSGAERVWCIRDQSIMRVLWWDPEHAVYPVEKDKADREKRRRRG